MKFKTLFKQGEYISHSGQSLPFKIDCDALTDEDIECIAEYISLNTEFGVVEGIPNGGVRLENALDKYAIHEAPTYYLVVDDVLTTGASMEEYKSRIIKYNVHPDDIVGWVIFARSEPPDWVHAMFRMD